MLGVKVDLLVRRLGLQQWNRFGHNYLLGRSPYLQGCINADCLKLEGNALADKLAEPLFRERDCVPTNGN